MASIAFPNTTFQLAQGHNLDPVDTGEYLRRVVTFANEAAFEEFGERNSCISTSYAVQFFLKAEGYDAELLRVEAAVFPNDRSMVGTILGRRTVVSDPELWAGHLVVSVAGQWLLDPTLDQANKPEWGAAQVTPVAIRPCEAFWSSERACHFFDLGGCEVRYQRHRRQDGYKNAPVARPKWWLPITCAITDKMAEADYFNRSRQ